MSNDIKVGDVCEIVDACCDRIRAVAVKHEVVVCAPPYPLSYAECKHCGAQNFDYLICEGVERLKAVPRHWLRKKPPKQCDDAEPRDDLVPADPNGWDLTHWHPNKTKETA